MNVIEAAKLQLQLKRRAAKLNTLIPDAEPLRNAVGIADTYQLGLKSIDVYGMVFSGIDIITAIHEAITLTHSMRLIHETEMLMQTAARVVTLPSPASASAMSVGRYLFLGNAIGVLGAYVGVWMTLGGAWAQAKADILTDQAMTGVSRGVVLGANDAAPSYVSRTFWVHAKPAYPAYREMEAAAKNMHNIALVAGYAQGKSLSRNQKGNMFRFLHARMTTGSRSTYSGDWNTWNGGTKKSYYIDCAALFRRDLLR